jgi:chromosome segregation ATPase
MAQPPEIPAAQDPLHRTREQLILAQVRILELEDERDEVTARLSAAETLLAQAQTLGDQKTQALTWLEQVHADLQHHWEELRRAHAATTAGLAEAQRAHDDAVEAFAQARRELVASSEALVQTRRELADTAARLAEAEVRHHELAEQIRRLEGEVAAAAAAAADRLRRLNELDGEVRALKASRSWRWSRPIRAVERWLARRRAP